MHKVQKETSIGGGSQLYCGELGRERPMFQWDRFITPNIIKTFYWLVIALICLFGISGIYSGLAAMAISPFGGFILLLSSIAMVVVGIIFSRIAAEFVLIVFRINEHLGAIRDQGEGN
jgi:predicted membrane metal-binding protein